MIRSSTQIDLDQLVKIWLEASLQAHHFIPASYWISNLQAMREQYLPASETYVWEDEMYKEVYGFVSLVDSTIAGLFVEPAHQKKGIGKALMRHAKTLRKELNLQVYVENVQAILFYERMGFVIQSERLDEATGKLEYVMQWQR